MSMQLPFFCAMTYFIVHHISHCVFWWRYLLIAIINEPLLWLNFTWNLMPLSRDILHLTTICDTSIVRLIKRISLGLTCTSKA
jgi:hypothetical protein